MKNSTLINSFLATAVVATLLFAAAKPAAADSFTIQWYTVPTGTADFYNGTNVPIGTSTNYVTNTLGPDGLPVYNPGYTTASGTVDPPNAAYLNSSGELLYWTPSTAANPNSGLVKADGAPTTINVSTSSATPTIMYPPGLGTDANFEATAVLSGSFTVLPGDSDTVTFDVGADDTAYVYVNGNLVEDLAGIHGNTALPSTTDIYGPGTYDIQIFYADRDVTQASLSFSDNDNLTITPTAVPEPGSFILLGTGLIAAAGAIRRRIRL